MLIVIILSRHGKGPSNGESAVVESGAARAVRSGEAIVSTAQELFDFLENSSLKNQPIENGCDKHIFRSFLGGFQVAVYQETETGSR